MTTKNKVGDKVIILSSWKDNVTIDTYRMFKKSTDRGIYCYEKYIEENIGKIVTIVVVRIGLLSGEEHYDVSDSKNRYFKIYHFQCKNISSILLPDRLFKI